MAGLPSSFNSRAVAPFEVGSRPSSSGNSNNARSVEQLVLDLCNSDLRENAMLELSKRRDIFPDLAPILWNSAGTVAALLQEIISIYPALSPPTLTIQQSNRICNALALLQCVASHKDTRRQFLNARMPQYLYPFMDTDSQSRPFEYLRVTSLGVISVLLKVDDTEVTKFLLSTEITPICLHAMEIGGSLSKTRATFIVHKILLSNMGLEYMCLTAQRFFAVNRVLATILAERPTSSELLKQIVRVYLRFSDDPRALDALRSCLPETLRDSTFHACLRNDPATRSCLHRLLHKVQRPPKAELPMFILRAINSI